MVTNQASITAAAERIRTELGRLDVLINNAAGYETRHVHPVLLRQAPAARIINVSSGVGSLTMNSDPANPYRAIFGPVYSASKTALNAMTFAMAIGSTGPICCVTSVRPVTNPGDAAYREWRPFFIVIPPPLRSNTHASHIPSSVMRYGGRRSSREATACPLPSHRSGSSCKFHSRSHLPG